MPSEIAKQVWIPQRLCLRSYPLRLAPTRLQLFRDRRPFPTASSNADWTQAAIAPSKFACQKRHIHQTPRWEWLTHLKPVRPRESRSDFHKGS